MFHELQWSSVASGRAICHQWYFSSFSACHGEIARFTIFELSIDWSGALKAMFQNIVKNLPVHMFTCFSRKNDNNHNWKDKKSKKR